MAIPSLNTSTCIVFFTISLLHLPHCVHFHLLCAGGVCLGDHCRRTEGKGPPPTQFKAHPPWPHSRRHMSGHLCQLQHHRLRIRGERRGSTMMEGAWLHMVGGVWLHLVGGCGFTIMGEVWLHMVGGCGSTWWVWVVVG